MVSLSLRTKDKLHLHVHVSAPRLQIAIDYPISHGVLSNEGANLSGLPLSYQAHPIFRVFNLNQR